MKPQNGSYSAPPPPPAFKFTMGKKDETARVRQKFEGKKKRYLQQLLFIVVLPIKDPDLFFWLVCIDRLEQKKKVDRIFPELYVCLSAGTGKAESTVEL